jgi:hypothetical protein
MLVHLTANVIPLGLHVTRQEIPQKLVRLGDCLVVSLLGFLEHLLGLLNLQLVGLHVILGRGGSLGPSSLQEYYSMFRQACQQPWPASCTASRVPFGG